MDAKQGPFSLYDFLGYFFPGAVAIFAGALCFDLLGLSPSPLDWLEISKLSELLPFVLTAYLLGHVLALLSSFSIERYFIWHFDYPSKSLIRLPSKRLLSNGSFSVVNIVKLVVWLLLLPITGVLAIICLFSIGRPGMVSQLDPLLARVIRGKIEGLMIDKGQVAQPSDYSDANESDFFRLVYHYTVENAPSHFGKMQNYVALFGFNRALSLLFVLLFWLSFISLVFDGRANSFLLVFVSIIFANVFFFGFAKFYRRFSLESLMALAVTYHIPGQVLNAVLTPPSAKKAVGVDIKSHGAPIMSLMRDLRRRARLIRKRW